MSISLPERLRRHGAPRPTGAAVRTACLVAIAVLLLPACSEQERTPGAKSQSLADAAPASSSSGRTRIDRKAAATLSLASSSDAEFDSEYERAVACASAIRTTIGVIRDYRGEIQSGEMQTLERAELIYRNSAITKGRAENESEQRVRSQIDKATEAGRQSAASQVQLSLVCLERLG
jgi:hypothetical protein